MRPYSFHKPTAVKQSIHSIYRKTFQENTEAAESGGLMVPKAEMTLGVLPSGCMTRKGAERQSLKQSALCNWLSGTTACSHFWTSMFCHILTFGALCQFRHILDYDKDVCIPP